MNRLLIPVLCLLALALAVSACSDDDDAGDSPQETTAAATASATPREPSPEQAEAAYRAFVAAVQRGDVEGAWALYAASVPGNNGDHLSDQGCSFDAFTSEFTRMQHMFNRTSPTEITGTYSDAPGSLVVEFDMTGADGQRFLVTMVRVQPDEDYRIKWMNNGETPLFQETPWPLASPDDPLGTCGIWTGGR